jgi:hypothetical protein
LNGSALRSYRRDDLRLELVYDATARTRVMAMIREEEDCCAFLAFSVHDDEPGTVRIVVEAPADGREAAGILFEAFRSREPARSACACCIGVS